MHSSNTLLDRKTGNSTKMTGQTARKDVRSQTSFAADAEFTAAEIMNVNAGAHYGRQLQINKEVQFKLQSDMR